MVILGFVFVSTKNFDGWEALDPILSAKLFMLVAIDGTDPDEALERLAGLLVFRNELLAMAAPGGVELDDPDPVGVLDPVVEVVRVQVHHSGISAVQSQGSSDRYGQQENGCRRKLQHGV